MCIRVGFSHNISEQSRITQEVALNQYSWFLKTRWHLFCTHHTPLNATLWVKPVVIEARFNRTKWKSVLIWITFYQKIARRPGCEQTEDNSKPFSNHSQFSMIGQYWNLIKVSPFPMAIEIAMTKITMTMMMMTMMMIMMIWNKMIMMIRTN